MSINPITREIIQTALAAAADEMMNTLVYRLSQLLSEQEVRLL